MLELAASQADGAFTNFLPLSGLPRIVEAVRAGEASAGRDAGSVELACRFFCVPGSAEEGLATAKFLFAAYATVPVYTEFFRWLGWGEQLDPMVAAWHEGDRARALELVARGPRPRRLHLRLLRRAARAPARVHRPAASRPRS